MRTIGLALISGLKIIAKILSMTLLLFCAGMFLSAKWQNFSVRQASVVRRCSGAYSMAAVCDCYNYYGRHCLSDRRLVWDHVPDDEADATSGAAHDLQEEIDYEESGESSDT